MRLNTSSLKGIIGTAATLSLLLGIACPQFTSSQENSSQTSAEVQSESLDSPAAANVSEDALDEAEPATASTVILDLETLAKTKAQSSASRQQPSNKADTTVRYKQGVACVPLMLVDDPNTLIVCDRDAVLRAEKRSIILTRGKGVYMVGKQPITVETALGTVTIPGNSAAIIEQADNGLLRVDHLTGAASSVAVKRWKGIKTYDACVGDEICLAPKGLSPNLLVPKDGVDRQEVSSEVGDAGIMLAENKFAPKTLLDKECLLQCDSNSFFQVRRRVYMLRKSIDEQMRDETGSNCSGAGSVSTGDNETMLLLTGLEPSTTQFKPVTLSEPANVQLALMHKNTGTAQVKFNEKTNISFAHPSVSELKSGEAVFSSYHTTFVKTPHSMIKIEPGALVLVSVSDDVTKLRTLWENNRNSVCQTVGNKPFHVLAGDESLASSELRSIYVSASKDMVGRRLTHYSELQNGEVVHFAEVSLMSLVQSSDLLTALMNSSEQEDQAVIRKANKMAAILVQISASHGLYELMQPPQWKRENKSSSLMPVLY